jgi:H+/Cl- antiporter ClcA
MTAGRLIAYIAAAIVILFGVLFIWAAFGDEFNSGWLVVGLISVAVGFGLIWFGGRLKPVIEGDTNVTLNIDLPGDVDMESLECDRCGGPLAPEDISMVAGAPVVTCPHCGSTYQITEAPKW